MRRVFASVLVMLGVATAWGLGCSASDEGVASSSLDAGSPKWDSGLVDPTEGGSLLDSGLGTPASCEKYCGLVMANCSGDNAQYTDFDECLAFCGRLPLNQPTREAEEKASATVACRQYWADSPSRTSPETYCLAAGPFGGNICGDRCTAYCSVVLDTCSPDGGTAVYGSAPDCASACANFAYRDAGSDGGGEGPADPGASDSLNCRLYQLRVAVTTTSVAACMALRPDGGACQ